LGYYGTEDYAHFIHTRHNSADSENAIDFYLCDGTQNNSLTSGANHVMSLVSGNVGIGNTDPSSLLHLTKTLDVGGSGMIDMLRIEWDDAGSEDTQAGDGTKISFGTSSVNNQPASVESAYIGAIRTSGAEASHNTDLVFGTKEDDSTDISEKMRIRNNGNVGIGTNNPWVPLHVVGDMYLESDEGSQWNFYPFENVIALSKVGTGEAEFNFGTSTTYTDAYFTMAVNKIKLNSNGNSWFNGGNVGIGTNNPSALLHVSGSSNPVISRISTSDNQTARLELCESTDGEHGGYMEYRGGDSDRVKIGVMNSYTDTAAITIQEDGSVGVGISSPERTLDVDGTFKVRGNDGFSGAVVAYNCERNGNYTTSNDDVRMAYGNGSSSAHGPTMPKNGTVLALTFSASANTGSGQLHLMGNDGETGDYITCDSTTNMNIAEGMHNFSAGDRLGMKLKVQSGTISNIVGSFYVRFD
jgi:hypothetical protein